MPPNSNEIMRVENLPVYRFIDNREYAFVRTPGAVIPCQGFGKGGDLVVNCATPQGGELVVRENRWTGWYAWRDGERVSLLEDRWLSVDAPAGEHLYRFRYLPWDVPLGIMLSLVGIAFSLWQWFQRSPSPNTLSRIRQ